MLSTTTALLLLINSIRPNKLINDTALQTMATERCINMQTFSHDDFYSIYSKKINEKYKYAGENLGLGYGSPKELFQSFEKSKTHRDNNHSKNYQKIGIATCPKPAGNGSIYLTVVLFSGN